MKRIILFLAIGSLGAWTTAAQTAASGQAGASEQSQTAGQTNNLGAQSSSTTASSMSGTANAGNAAAIIPSETKIDATLATSLDAKRSRVGDDVEVRTEEDIKEDGKVILKKGAHLVGHVTQAQARANGQAPSRLGIVFDHAVLKDGQEVPFSASIQALASAPEAAAGADEMMASGGGVSTMHGSSRSGGLVSGVASTAGATAGATTGTIMNTSSPVPLNAGGTLNSVTRSSGAVGGLTSTGRLASNSSGVFGLDGLAIDSAASSATQGSVIVSATKNVHLDSGTQLLLRTTGQGQ